MLLAFTTQHGDVDVSQAHMLCECESQVLFVGTGFFRNKSDESDLYKPALKVFDNAAQRDFRIVEGR